MPRHILGERRRAEVGALLVVGEGRLEEECPRQHLLLRASRARPRVEKRPDRAARLCTGAMR